MKILNKIFGDANEKYLNTQKKLLTEINNKEKDITKLTQSEIQEKILFLKKEIKNNNFNNLPLEFLIEIFALTRESAYRTLKQRHFDEQILGGLALSEGKITEMKTGEGKTLTATLAATSNSLFEKGVHIITVNDYLAKRDTVWMGQIYHYLGLSVSCLTQNSAYIYDPSYQTENAEQNDEKRDLIGSFKVLENYLRPCSRQEAYLTDITYGTNTEFGFDYLRDNLIYDLKDKVQREHYFAVVDEVDSILIDEARTPLIISMPDEEAGKLYQEFTKIVPRLQKETDYLIDEKLKTVSLTEEGLNKIEQIFGFDIYNKKGLTFVHHLEEALKAHILFKKDRNYVVKDNQVVIVDEFTGRLLHGRRYAGGLHQALEAKEQVPIQKESRTAATITIQNYFRLYKKLSGMTGTAATSAEEFFKVYKLDTIIIPTHKPMIRKDLSDLVYRTEKGKLKAIAKEVKERRQKGQPVLIGTVSIEKNELIANYLQREGIPFEILNAKNHEREGEIIAQAGKLGAVTLATNMAGRGVDIILGGNPPDPQEKEKVLNLNGLHVIGTERHEARRIDNQLRGRSGRQGDCGSSQFFISLEDDLMRVFAPKNIANLMLKIGLAEDQPIDHPLITKALESAQTKIEGFHFDARKNILEYDDVINRQRITFYNQRQDILKKDRDGSLKEWIKEIFQKNDLVFPEESFAKKIELISENQILLIIKIFIIQVLDSLWIDHLEDMEYLRSATSLRAYAQTDPLIEYKKESHRFYQQLKEKLETRIIDGVQKILASDIKKENPQSSPVIFTTPNKSNTTKIGRNDFCSCGSGKKFKKCCGKDN